MNQKALQQWRQKGHCTHLNPKLHNTMPSFTAKRRDQINMSMFTTSPHPTLPLLVSAPRTSLLSTLKMRLNCPKSNTQRGQPKFQNPSLAFLPVVLSSLTLHIFWSVHTGPLRETYPVCELESNRKAKVEFGSLSWNHRSTPEGNTANPIQSQGLSTQQGLLWHSPGVCHQSTPSDWHRPSFPQGGGSFWWANFSQPASVLCRASLHHCFPNLQLFDLSKFTRIHIYS